MSGLSGLWATLVAWWHRYVVKRVGYRGDLVELAANTIDINRVDERMRERDLKLNQLEVLLVLLNVRTDLSTKPYKRRF